MLLSPLLLNNMATFSEIITAGKGKIFQKHIVNNKLGSSKLLCLRRSWRQDLWNNYNYFLATFCLKTFISNRLVPPSSQPLPPHVHPPKHELERPVQQRLKYKALSIPHFSQLTSFSKSNRHNRQKERGSREKQTCRRLHWRPLTHLLPGILALSNRVSQCWIFQ